MNKKYHVILSTSQRAEIQKEIRQGGIKPRRLRRCYILLGADQSDGGKAMTDEEISKAYGVTTRTIQNVRKQFVENGLEKTLTRRAHKVPPNQKVYGDAEAHLIALSRSEPPEGRSRWTIRLLAQKMVELEYIDSISRETVRVILKKQA